MVSLSNGKYGRVCLTELAEPTGWSDGTALVGQDGPEASAGLALPDGRKHGDLVKCRVLAVDEEHDCVELSLRPSRVVSHRESLILSYRRMMIAKKDCHDIKMFSDKSFLKSYLTKAVAFGSACVLSLSAQSFINERFSLITTSSLYY
jgi:hypothetical protein